MKKYILISALIHVVIFATIFLNNKNTEIIKKPKPIKITVVAMQIQKEEEIKPPEEPKPKPPQKPKSIKEKKTVTPKPIVRPEIVTKAETLVKPEIITKPVIETEPTAKPEVVAQTKIIFKEPAEPIEPIVPLEEIQNIKDIYLTNFRKTIEQKKVYPVNAKKLRQSGTVKVKLTILHDGTIKNVHIMESSSFKLLDNATLKVLQEIAKISPFPKELRDTEMQIIIPIEYKLG